MLDIEDIKKLTKYLTEAFKDVFMTQEYGKKLETKIDKVQTSLDAVLKDKQNRDQEVKVLNYRMKQAEDVLDKVAPKLGLKYEH
jgi:hypothetical protein